MDVQDHFSQDSGLLDRPKNAAVDGPRARAVYLQAAIRLDSPQLFNQQPVTGLLKNNYIASAQPAQTADQHKVTVPVFRLQTLSVDAQEAQQDHVVPLEDRVDDFLFGLIRSLDQLSLYALDFPEDLREAVDGLEQVDRIGA